jgi:Predicted membrane protein
VSDVFDPGLQPERTALAWRRTGLALLAGSLVGTRILPEALGPLAAIPALTGVTASAALLYAIQSRYRRHRDHLSTGGDRSPIAGGGLIAATALIVVCAGVLTLVLTLAIAGHPPHR